MIKATPGLTSLESPPRLGRITVPHNQSLRIQRRWIGLPTSRIRVMIDGRFEYGAPDCCWLDYRATRRTPGYLTLDYIRSGPQTTFKTFRRALMTLDLVAKRLSSTAIFAEVCNDAISARLLRRWGWEPLNAHSTNRLWIKRLYQEIENWY